MGQLASWPAEEGWLGRSGLCNPSSTVPELSLSIAAVACVPLWLLPHRQGALYRGRTDAVNQSIVPGSKIPARATPASAGQLKQTDTVARTGVAIYNCHHAVFDFSLFELLRALVQHCRGILVCFSLVVCLGIAVRTLVVPLTLSCTWHTCLSPLLEPSPERCVPLWLPPTMHRTFVLVIPNSPPMTNLSA